MTAIIDIETDSLDVVTAQLKFFGALDCETGEVTILDYTQKTKIRNYIKSHKVLVGYNIRGFDEPILKTYGVSLFGHTFVDLYQCLAPPGLDTYSSGHKNRLKDINPDLLRQLKDNKLDTIVKVLGLDDKGKIEMDYNILKKNSWTIQEKNLIEDYLKQDLLIENKLFLWYKNVFQPLESYLPEEVVAEYKHLTCSTGTLAYRVMCHQLGLVEEYEDEVIARSLKSQSEKIEGGHHIHARWEKVRGNIICRDFVSHYPTIMIMYNLLDKEKLEVLTRLLNERIQAKKNGDKAKALALKVPINSIYGILGNPTFKQIYNPRAASECTRLGRELLRRYAQTLDVAGFIPLYGFTDSVYVGIPKGLTEEDLNAITDHYIQTIKKEAPTQVDSFNLGIDGRIKFIWFIEKQDNQYLYVTTDNKIKIKGSLFDKNTPESVRTLYEDYIKPKILSELDINFTKEELVEKLIELIFTNPLIAAEEYNVKELSNYCVTTTMQYQISNRYGAGRHKLIPNNAGVGVGQDINYCTLEEFNAANLTIENIHVGKMIKYIEPFYSTKEKVVDL